VSSPRRTARGRYKAEAIRHSVGGKVAGDKSLWKCCNPDTSGGKWRRLSRGCPDRTFRRRSLLPFAEPVWCHPPSTPLDEPARKPRLHPGAFVSSSFQLIIKSTAAAAGSLSPEILEPVGRQGRIRPRARDRARIKTHARSAFECSTPALRDPDVTDLDRPGASTRTKPLSIRS
jgi:hypothetical protein